VIKNVMINKDKKDIQFEQPSDILLLTNRYIIFVIAFVVAAILLLGYFFILAPKITSINSIEKETTKTEERKENNQILLNSLKEIEAEYQDIMNNRQTDLAALKTMVPQGPQTAELFLLADRLATKYNLQLIDIALVENVPQKISTNNVSPEATSEETAEQIEPEVVTIDELLIASGLKAIIVRLTVAKVINEGEYVSGKDVYNNFKNYLAALENNMRLLDVQSIAFQAIDAEVVSSYNFNVNLITYYQ